MSQLVNKLSLSHSSVPFRDVSLCWPSGLCRLGFELRDMSRDRLKVKQEPVGRVGLKCLKQLRALWITQIETMSPITHRSKGLMTR